MNELQDVVNEFLVESYENLDQLDRDLVALEQEPSSQHTLSSVFRTIHTIKGTCGFLGFGKLECVAHVGESLLCKLREGQLELNSAITTGLLSLVDAIREILSNIETIGAEGEADYSELVQTLIGLQGGPLEDAFAIHPDDEEPDLIPEPAQQSSAHSQSVDNAGATAPVSTAIARESSTAAGSCASPVREPSRARSERRSAGLSDSTIRVDVELLDKLMNRVGELVLARNQILQYISHSGDAALISTSQRLNLITTELQEGVMKTRMQPIGNIWSKFPRVVRDLAVHCGKQVRIEMEGKDTELDKTIVEAIKDPLTHLVRNSVDHGIESPEARLAAGKPAEGRLRLRAFHEGGQVNIEISDDGGGLNFDRIRQKGIERGLITHEQALRMNDREAAQLIFTPGFSTAGKITNLSGRGVGMDVVKTNIERIGGAVEIGSQTGRGTTIRIKIPLTLAIIPALIVTCDGDRFAIPQVSLLELVRLDGEQARHRIERLHGVPVYRLRGKLLPIVDLRRELHLPEAASPRGVLNIVVLRADDRQFGLVVDSINDTEEIVVKPLSQQLKGIPLYAGATIMGDGRVALIIDVLGMAQRANVVSEVRDRTLNDQQSHSRETETARQTLLVLEVGERRLALPISQVARLEEISPAAVEQADDQEMVQYRGQILPLLRLGQVLGIPARPRSDAPLQVVVYFHGGRSIGLIVDRIADIVPCDLDVQRKARGAGLLASAVIQERVTDLLNVPALVRRVDPTFSDEAPLEGAPA